MSNNMNVHDTIWAIVVTLSQWEYENEYISSDGVEFLGITNNLGKVGV